MTSESESDRLMYKIKFPAHGRNVDWGAKDSYKEIMKVTSKCGL